MAEVTDWLGELPEPVQAGLARVARAVMGMSEADKEDTASRLQRLCEDESAPPALRVFTRDCSRLLVAGMPYAKNPTEPGHMDRAARIEEVRRRVADVKRRQTELRARQRGRNTRGPSSPPSF